jgi:hypothetical protein
MLGYLDFRFPEGGWRRCHPKLAAWFETTEKLPSMQATKPPRGMRSKRVAETRDNRYQHRGIATAEPPQWPNETPLR